MKVIILAAGRGSRMNEYTKDIPKCMLKLGGISLIERQIRTLNEAGIEDKDIIIVTGYEAEKIDITGIKMIKNEKWDNTNMVKTLLKAEYFLENEECIISYSDIAYDPSCINILKKSTKDIIIPYYTGFENLWRMRFEDPLEDIESFKVINGELKEIGKKVSDINEVEGQYMGILKVTPKGWKEIKDFMELLSVKIIEKIDITTLLSKLINSGVKIYAVEYGGLWLECDNQNDIKLYEENRMI